MISRIVTNCQNNMLLLLLLDTLPVDLHLVSFHRKSMGFVSSFGKLNNFQLKSKSLTY